MGDEDTPSSVCRRTWCCRCAIAAIMGARRAMLRVAVAAGISAMPLGRMAVCLGAFAAAKAAIACRNGDERNASGVDDDADANRDQVELEWAHVTCKVEIEVEAETENEDGTRSKAKRRETKTILADAVGRATPGRVLAVLGPSGSGKSTLLGSIAGQLPHAPSCELRGRLLANGRPLSRAAFRIAFVQQTDLFFSQLTVQETLDMGAALRLPRSIGPQQRAARVHAVVASLNLSSCLATPVGDLATGKGRRGISGGEAKRLSIALELLSDPHVLICDEPTTGLDAFQVSIPAPSSHPPIIITDTPTQPTNQPTNQPTTCVHVHAQAEQVVRVLASLARERGIAVVMSVHQPRASIFAQLDDVHVLGPGGITLFHGPASKGRRSLLALLATADVPCPPGTNPAEAVLDAVSVDGPHRQAMQKAFAPDARAMAVTVDAAWANTRGKGEGGEGGEGGGKGKGGGVSGKGREASGVGEGRVRPSSPWWVQVRRLYWRAFRQVVRDRATNVLRASTNVNSALLFGSIYWRLRKTQTTIQDRMGLLQVSPHHSNLHTTLPPTLPLPTPPHPPLTHTQESFYWPPSSQSLSHYVPGLTKPLMLVDFRGLRWWR